MSDEDKLARAFREDPDYFRPTNMVPLEPPKIIRSVPPAPRPPGAEFVTLDELTEVIKQLAARIETLEAPKPPAPPGEQPVTIEALGECLREIGRRLDNCEVHDELVDERFQALKYSKKVKTVRTRRDAGGNLVAEVFEQTEDPE